jgi:hypothetical protein
MRYVLPKVHEGQQGSVDNIGSVTEEFVKRLDFLLSF